MTTKPTTQAHNIRERLIYYRTLRGFSQHQIAAACNVHRSTVTGWERVKNPTSISVEHLTAIAEALDVTREHLISKPMVFAAKFRERLNQQSNRDEIVQACSEALSPTLVKNIMDSKLPTHTRFGDIAATLAKAVRSQTKNLF